MSTAVASMPTAADAAPPSALSNARVARIASLDIVRGVIMVLMAIDHVRVYSGVPAGGPDPAVFFTRWVTNFVAPAFAFLAGTAAWLYGRRVATRGDLARFLVTRGAWLVLLELTVMRFAWTFNFDYAHYVLAGVLWMLGWCMILLATMVWLPTAAIAAIGLVVIFGHNLVPVLVPAEVLRSTTSLDWLWQVLYFGGPIQVGSSGSFGVLYSLVPWVGVMAAGYAFGPVMAWPVETRRKFCLRVGVGAILLFVILRFTEVYGDPTAWRASTLAQRAAARAAQSRTAPAPPAPSTSPTAAPSTTVPGATPATAGSQPVQPPAAPRARPPQTPAVLRFLGTVKYPASLLFLLMTLGPMLVAIPLLERARGRAASALATLGRVPLFFYVLHIPLIHVLALLVSWLREGTVNGWLFLNHPYAVPESPAGYMWSLPLLYLVTAIAVVLLYFPSRWFARLKSERPRPWMSYL